MRIARVSERSYPERGGKEVHVWELSRRQAAMGHDVVLYVSVGEPPSSAVRTRHVASSVPQFANGALARTALFAALAGRRLERDGRLDVIHAHGDFIEAALLGRTAMRLGRPLVMTVHGRLNRRWRHASTRAFARVTRFVAVSEGVREDLAACGVPTGAVTVIPSGFSPALVSQAGQPQSACGVVAVGSFDPVKNHEGLLQAMRIVWREVPNLPLTLVGDGRLRRRLESEVRPSEPVSFLGWVSRDRVHRCVAAAQVFVLPSLALPGKAEGTSTALLEALALGVPCVVSLDAIPALGRAGAGAYLTARPDPASLSGAILRVLKEHDLANELRTRGPRAVGHLEWDAVVRRVTEVLGMHHDSRGAA